MGLARVKRVERGQDRRNRGLVRGQAGNPYLSFASRCVKAPPRPRSAQGCVNGVPAS